MASGATPSSPGAPSRCLVTGPVAWCTLPWSYWLYFLGIIPSVWMEKQNQGKDLPIVVSLPLSLIFSLLDQCYSKCGLLASCRTSPLSISKFMYVLLGVSAQKKSNSQRDSPNPLILQMRILKPSLPSLVAESELEPKSTRIYNINLTAFIAPGLPMSINKLVKFIDRTLVLLPFRLASGFDCFPYRSCWSFHCSPPFESPQMLRPVLPKFFTLRPQRPKYTKWPAGGGATPVPRPLPRPTVDWAGAWRHAVLAKQMGFGASVGLRRAALGARSASAVGSEPGLLPPQPPLQRGVQPRARPGPGQEHRWVGARWRRARAARSGLGGGHRGHSPPPSRCSPELPGRGAGGGGGTARESGARGAAGAFGAGSRRPAPPPGWASARTRAGHCAPPRATEGRSDRRAGGGRERGLGSGLKPRRLRIGRGEAADRLSHLGDQRLVRKSGPGWGSPRTVAPAWARAPCPSCPSAGELEPALNLPRDPAELRLGSCFSLPAGARRQWVGPSWWWSHSALSPRVCDVRCSRRWAVMSLQALAGTLARKGRLVPERRERKFSLESLRVWIETCSVPAF